MLLIAWQEIPARSSEASVYLVQGCGLAIGLLEVRTATDWIRPRARQDRVLRLAGVVPVRRRGRGGKREREREGQVERRMGVVFATVPVEDESVRIIGEGARRRDAHRQVDAAASKGLDRDSC